MRLQIVRCEISCRFHQCNENLLSERQPFKLTSVQRVGTNLYRFIQRNIGKKLLTSKEHIKVLMEFSSKFWMNLAKVNESKMQFSEYKWRTGSKTTWIKWALQGYFVCEFWGDHTFVDAASQWVESCHKFPKPTVFCCLIVEGVFGVSALV